MLWPRQTEVQWHAEYALIMPVKEFITLVFISQQSQANYEFSANLFFSMQISDEVKMKN